MEDIKKETAETAAEETSSQTEKEALLSDGAVDNQVSKLEMLLKESEEKHLRVLAEFDNFRKRSKKEQESLYSSAFSSGVASFLPVLDNIDRAVKQECRDEKYKEGILLIDKQLKDLCVKLGIQEYAETGETFDPALHNAVMHIDDETLGENEICEVLQKGYKMGDRIIRIAMVKVAN